jgi:tripartite-type tricarboxylate transporter receptor subunit TctC
MLKAKTSWFGFFITAVMGLILGVDYGMAADNTIFNRKVIEIIVCTKVGGGYDTDARLIAPYLQKELPGSLNIGVANIPGLIAAQIRKEEGMQFDLRKFTWLGRLYSRHRFLFARKNAGFDTVDALIKSNKDFKIACAGVGDGPYNTGLLTAEALGLKKVRLIPNYGGGEEPYGIMRKEVEAAIGGLESWQEMIDQQEVVPILSYDAKRYAATPNVPTLTELVKTPSGIALAAYISGESELSRAIFTTPNLPENITQTLRSAFMKALQNEGFKKTVAMMKREPFNPLPGDDVAKRVTAAMNLPSDITNLIIKVSKTQ